MFEKDLLDDTCMEPPETPAPMFAVRAFKHALFGTPQPVARDHTIRTLKKMKDLEESKDAPKQEKEMGKNPTLEKPEESSRPCSPTKPGILLTPGTIRTRRKGVTFGAQVVDNESKKPSRSGIPNNCPGKFPSPWTPKIVDAPEEKRPKTKLTEELYSARATGTSPKKPKITRARDDGDITMDMMEPRSESGRYWKEQYMSYSQKSEEETKKLIAKQKLAKEYARKKDAEATDYRRQLEQEKNRRRGKEASLKDEVKELREHLRKALAENLQASTELALLRQRLEKKNPEQGETTRSAPPHKAKPSAFDDNFSLVIEATKTTSTTMPLSQSPNIPGSLWEDAAVTDEEHSRVIRPHDISESLIQSRGERAKQNRSQNSRRLTRKSGIIGRTDSGLSPSKKSEDILIFNAPSENIALSGVATHTAKQSTRGALGERNPNIVVSIPASPSKSIIVEEAAGNSSKLFDPSLFLESFNADAFDASVFDAGATMEALTLQAEQPTTPNSPAKGTSRIQSGTPVPSSRKHQRTHAKVLSTAPSIPGDRATAAKARLEERRAARSREKENSRISR
jgi:hypothetical protein